MKISFISKMAWQNIKSNRKLYIPYMMAASTTVAMFIMMSALLTNKFVQERSAVLTSLFGMGTIVIGIFSLIFIFYTNSFLMKRRKKELGLYSILGLEKKHVNTILGMETIIAGSISIISGMIVGILFGKMSFLILNYVLNFPVEIEYSIGWNTFGLTIALFIGIFFLTMLFNITQVTFSNPIRLLKGGKEGEKEPKSSPILFVLGLLSLGAGYYISLTITDPLSALTKFFVAVLLVIIGTYLLFTAGSIIVLKLLKKNKKLYYKPGPFISISGMLYRMKQHAVGLANISILSVMVIIAVSTTITLFLGTEEALSTRFPSENNVTMSPPDMSGEELEQNTEVLYDRVKQYTEEQNLQFKDGVKYQSVNLFGKLKENIFDIREIRDADGTMLLLFPLEDFNQMSAKEYDLKEGEVLVYSNRSSLDLDSFTIAEKEYNAIPIKEVPEMVKANTQIVDTIIAVLPTVQDIDEVLNYYNEVPGNIDSQWNAEYHWNTTGSEAVKKDYANEINEITQADDLKVSGYYESRESSRQEWYSMNGGFLFLGIFLGGLFTIGALLITYFKQVSEGYDDRERIQIMQKVGLDKQTTRQATHSQIVWMFTLPILTAAIHTAFAYPIIHKLLMIFGIMQHKLLILCTVGVVVAFALIYWVIYRITSKVYLSIVE